MVRLVSKFLSPAFIGFFTRKTILLLVAFFVFVTQGIPFLFPQSSPTSTIELKHNAGSIWTSTREMTAEQNAAAHFKKHGRDFKFTSQEEYINAAHEFLSNPPIGTISVMQRDGDVVLYDPIKNWFGVKTKNGIPRTLFQPDPKIHGYKTNMDYFNAQKTREQ